MKLFKISGRPPLKIKTGKPIFAYEGLSENITKNDLEDIIKAVEVKLKGKAKGVVITHGTDNMLHTARLLANYFDERLTILNKVILLTGSIKGIDEEGTDVWDNLELALFSVNKITSKPGVYVAFNGVLTPGKDIVEEPYNGETLKYSNSNDETYIQKIARDHSEQFKKIIELEKSLGHEESLVYRYDVNQIRENHDEFLSVLKPDAKSVLLTLYHSGSANTLTPGVSIVDLMKQIIENTDAVVFAVTGNGEPLKLDRYETCIALRQAGVVPLYNMKKQVAFRKLQLLSSKFERQELIIGMLKSYVGEIDEEQVVAHNIDELLTIYK